MIVVCPECLSDDLALVRIQDDGRRFVRCGSCGHEWARGEPAQPRGPILTPIAGSRRDPEPWRTIIDDDEGYLRWLRSWPAGYVLNCDRNPNPNYIMLHRSYCEHISEPGSLKTTWTTSYIKVCSNDRQRIREWAIHQTGSYPTPCLHCI